MERNNRVKAGRIKVGYNQKEMAEEMEMPLGTYKDKESYRTEFTESEINKYLKITGEKYEDVFMPGTCQRVG